MNQGLSGKISTPQELRGTISGPTQIVVVQATGDSEDFVMSQKAVTDELNKKVGSAQLTEMEATITDHVKSYVESEILGGAW